MTLILPPNTPDDVRLEKVTAHEADNRDRALARLEQNREMLLVAAKRDYEARVERIEREAREGRDGVWRQFESAVDATRNFIETRNDRARAASVGLGLPFLHPTKVQSRQIAEGLRADGWEPGRAHIYKNGRFVPVETAHV